MVSVAAVLLAGSLFAQEKNYIDQPYIEVTGKAEMEVVQTKSTCVSSSTKKGQQKARYRSTSRKKEMFKQLKGIGIDLEKEPRRTRYVQRSANLLPA